MPLLTPKTEEADLLSKQEEESLIARMKMFVHLRQDLERVSKKIDHYKSMLYRELSLAFGTRKDPP